MACKQLTHIKLSDILKRLPPNQIKQFQAFQLKRGEYKLRVEKFPEFLPKIDWAYYRANVRPEYVKMVDEFEKKYADMNKMFDSRLEFDTKCYYVELEKEREEVKLDIEKYICESNARIKTLNDEIERLKAMLPYDQMTMEDYVDTHQHPLYTENGTPSFWPHTPEEQRVGPSVTEEDRRLALEAALELENKAKKKIAPPKNV